MTETCFFNYFLNILETEREVNHDGLCCRHSKKHTLVLSCSDHDRRKSITPMSIIQRVGKEPWLYIDFCHLSVHKKDTYETKDWMMCDRCMIVWSQRSRCWALFCHKSTKDFSQVSCRRTLPRFFLQMTLDVQLFDRRKRLSRGIGPSSTARVLPSSW